MSKIKVGQYYEWYSSDGVIHSIYKVLDIKKNKVKVLILKDGIGLHTGIKSEGNYKHHLIRNCKIVPNIRVQLLYENR